MKKLLTMILAAGLCGIASAASVNWSVAGQSFTTSDGSNTRAKDYLVLVFLDSDKSAVTTALSSGDASAVSAALATYTSAEGFSATTKATGAASGSFTSSESVGTTLTLWSVAFDGKTVADSTSYLLSSTSVLSDVYEAPATPTNKGAFSAASYSGSSWTKMEAVPEPSVALMGLLGIGMLIRRRKA